ncbi:MAG: helix-hairpin-helix domain-containing protein [Paludibacteraceae bacterium]|nr:helix-hairpin-helix domain-containing protein [Paludibacteraceae bacterium]
MLLAKEQRIGAAIVFGIALIVWIMVAVWPSRQVTLPDPDSPTPKRSWEERKDSMRRADSIRYAQWAAEREQRYDSFRLADSTRRAQWKTEQLHRRDSARIADSLWRDSMGINYTKRIKKDTIIDLNHCDTTDLLFIRGIGHYSAIQIVKYREQLGGYYNPSQLTDEALSKCHLDTLLPHFTANPDDVHRLNVNNCSIDRLQRHPYLRYEQAKSIYTLRRQRLRLNSIDDLRALPELTEDDLLRLAPYLSFD